MTPCRLHLLLGLREQQAIGAVDMVFNAKIILLVGILAIGINFFPERGLTDAAPVQDYDVITAIRKAFDERGLFDAAHVKYPALTPAQQEFEEAHRHFPTWCEGRRR
ncbi:uncharacterized protein LOC124161155 [Ischnura elegans]|uniref:uncharacterized protein LOC124161155 n=1 Tax=Ischnura elegans TaxID=197161 RepID=UPI001ED8A33E|nr:uncharacterized protein LOC124161155 [Ischnura elegans]